MVKKHHFLYITASHLDLYWLGTPKTCLERGAQVIRAYLEECRRNSERTYLIETTIFADYFLWRFPEYRNLFMRLYREGRLEIGACYVDRYENGTSGECLVRQLLAGQSWCKRVLGDYQPFVTHPDLPAYTPQTAQIHAKSHVQLYLTSRKAFPKGGVFRMRAPDGTETLHCHFVRGYGFFELEDLSWKMSESSKGFPGGPAVLAGGAADLAGPETFVERFGRPLEAFVEGYRKKYPNSTFSYGSLRDILNHFGKRRLPVRSGEVPSVWGSLKPLFPQFVEKQKRLENTLLEAEFLECLCTTLLGRSTVPKHKPWRAQYDERVFFGRRHLIPKGHELDELWKMLLMTHDHNNAGWEGDLSDYQKLEMTDRGQDYANQIRNHGLNLLADDLPRQRGKGQPLLLFNFLPWDRGDIAYLTLNKDQYSPERIELRHGAKGKRLSVQLESEDRTTFRIAVDVQSVPSVGFLPLRLVKTASPSGGEVGGGEISESPDAIRINNSFTDLRFTNSDGSLISWMDRSLQEQLIHESDLPFASLLGFRESGSDVSFRVDEGCPPEREKVERVSILNHGPLFTTLRVEGHIYQSRYEKDIVVYHTRRRVDIRLVLHWSGEQMVQLRMHFPFNLFCKDLHYDCAFYVNPKDNLMAGAGPFQPDEVEPDIFQRMREAVNWLDVACPDFGVTVASARTAYLIKNSTVEPILLRSVWSCGDPRYFYHRGGREEWRFVLMPHQGDWQRGGAFYRGAEATHPLAMHLTRPRRSFTRANVPRSCVRLTPTNVVLSAVKPAANRQGVVLRLYELEGRAAQCNLRLWKEFRHVWDADMLEQPQRLLKARGRSVVFRVRPHEIKTLLLE